MFLLLLSSNPIQEKQLYATDEPNDVHADFLKLDLPVGYEPLSLFFSQSLNEPRHEISNNVVYATNKAPDQPAHTQSDQSLC